MGHRIAIFPNTALRVAVKAIQDAMRVLRADGSTAALLDRMVTWDERQRLVGLPEYEQLDHRFAASARGVGAAEDRARRGSEVGAPTGDAGTGVPSGAAGESARRPA